MIAATVHLTVAKHYCGGYLAATLVSLDGELASCGMENHSGTDLADVSISRNCCEDITSTYGIDNDFVPEYVNIEQPFPNAAYNLIVPGNITKGNITLPEISNYNITPPGDFEPYSTDLQVLCVFRI